MLQYITNENCGRSIADQIKAVIEGGCRWVQIRMKNASDHEIAEVVEEIKPLCEKEEVFLLLDDRVELAKEVNVGGVHLGKEDMPPSKARVILGPAAVIGATANTIEDIRALKSLDIDYIGIGPFRNTATKQKLAPILGLEGVGAICRDMEAEEINIAHVAIGGITLDDVDNLMQAGVNGIAVSGAIANAEDMVAATRRFVDKLRPYLREAEELVAED